MVDDRAFWPWHVAEVAGDGRGAAGGGGEELRARQHVEIDEYAAQRAREELRAQQPAAVDDSVPGLADDAAGRGEATRRQATEHVRSQHLLLQHRHVTLVLLLHRSRRLIEVLLMLPPPRGGQVCFILKGGTTASESEPDRQDRSRNLIG